MLGLFSHSSVPRHLGSSQCSLVNNATVNHLVHDSGHMCNCFLRERKREFCEYWGMCFLYLSRSCHIAPPPECVFPPTLANKHISFDYKTHPLLCIPTVYQLQRGGISEVGLEQEWDLDMLLVRVTFIECLLCHRVCTQHTFGPSLLIRNCHGLEGTKEAWRLSSKQILRSPLSWLLGSRKTK